MAILAASGGDAVKIVDTAARSDDEAVLQECTPSPDRTINCVRWNHTNMVVAAAGEDRQISLWSPKLDSLASIKVDNVEEKINAINFSNSSPRYLCSGGTGKVVKIWDMQKQMCIKWLRGHVDTITDAAYNNRDEQVASVSIRGDLIVHSLASGSRVAELKDPRQQVLRFLDFSRMSRHLVATAGDDGSVHVWDTTGRSPKVSWLKQHLAPASGVFFSPHNDKVVMSIGYDKKLFIYDTGVKKPVHCISCETWHSSAAIKDDGTTLAGGTSLGRVILYDVRGKPQAGSVIHCFIRKPVTSVSFQRSKPLIVNEKRLTLEMALLGPPGGDEPVIMPDPLPPTARGRVSNTPMTSSLENSRPPTGEATPLSRLQTFRGGFGFRDDMEVFSPLVEVQPLMSTTKPWDFTTEPKRFLETNQSPTVTTPPASFSSGVERSPSVTPPEAWGGEGGVQPRAVQPSRFATRVTGISSASASYSGHIDNGVGFPALAPQTPPSTGKELQLSEPSPGSHSELQDGGTYYPALETFQSPAQTEKRDLDHHPGTSPNPSYSNGQASTFQKYTPELQGAPPSSFGLQLVQRALEESLNGVHKSIHEDVHNLHLDLIRQFHIQQRGTEELLQKLLKNQAELLEQVQTLRRDNQELRQYL